MKNIRRTLVAAATATAVALSGTAVATAQEGAEPTVAAQATGVNTAGDGEGSDDDGTTAPGLPDKDAGSSSDFNEVFGSWVPDKETGEPQFQFAQALKSMKNIAAFGTAIAGILGVILTLSTKLPQVLELFGIDTPSKK